MLRKKLPTNLYYHGVHHSIDVYDAAKLLAEQENLNEINKELLLIAAIFHDSGFIEQYHSNESKGAKLAQDILIKLNYKEEFILQVQEIIMSTKLFVEPKNKLEQIMSDADFDYLGRNDFHEIAEKLRLELNENGYSFSQKQWDEEQIKFLEKHKYYTSSAIKNRLTKKKENLEEIKVRLAKY